MHEIYWQAASTAAPAPWWVPLVAAFIGAIFGGGATLLGVHLTHRAALRGARLADKRQLRDAKAARLRALYAPYVEVSLVMEQVSAEKGFVMSHETRDERDARHETLMHNAMTKAQQGHASALLDSDASRVLAAYKDTYAAFDAYLRTDKNLGGEVGSDYATQRSREFNVLKYAATRLKASASADLERLAEPI